MFSMVVAHAEDCENAAPDMIGRCLGQLAGRPAKAAFVLASIDAPHQPLLDAINEEWPGIPLIGGTTDGEMSSELGFLEDSAVLAVFTGDDGIQVTTAVGRDASSDVAGACAATIAAARAGASLPPRLCLTVPESLTMNSGTVVSALTASLGMGIPLVGGTCGDQSRFSGTRQFFGREVVSDAVPVMLFSGDIACSFGVASGWSPISEPGVATRTEGTVVHCIDGQPAIDFYRRNLGSFERLNSEFPLVVVDGNGAGTYLRTTNGNVDAVSGAVSFFGDVPEGASVRIAAAGRAEILSGCDESIRIARERFPRQRQPTCALIFSCAGRKFLLGTRTTEEARHVASLLEGIPYAGFYSYGEIAANVAGSAALFHNQTFVTVLFGG
jgi:hypothetical protein